MKTSTKIWIGVGLAAGVALVVWLRKKNFDPNKGTPYEGFGLPGTLGNFFNQLLGGAPEAAASAIGDWFVPDPAGDSVFYIVNFPDGERHAIGAGTVASDGTFDYNSVHYRISVSGGEKYAIAQGS